jgi:outer membrane protein TolC
MMRSPLILASLATLLLGAEEPLSLPQAIHRAWTQQAGLQAGEAMVARARSEAEAARDLRLPTLTASAGLQRTNEPMMAFGMKLNQARIAQVDFLPSNLNHPDPMTGAGLALSLNQPIYAGGRLEAARRAGQSLAAAEVAAQAHRKQQVALAVVQAYFGSRVAEQGVDWAEDTLRQAQETERFVAARVAQGMMLQSEADRARAFRAQAEAGVAEARQRLATARSGLALLIGGETDTGPLSTSLDEPQPEAAAVVAPRGDLEAVRRRVEASQAGTRAAQGSLLPEVGVTASLGSARYSFGSGGNWNFVALGAKWTLSFADARRVSAARAQERAASLGLRWQEQQAFREIEEARRAVETAKARLGFAREAVAASESARAIRTARHREGLLPLVEVLDAEAGLSGARTLLLNSQLDYRLSRAALAMALGQPIENVKE